MGQGKATMMDLATAYYAAVTTLTDGYADKAHVMETTEHPDGRIVTISIHIRRRTTTTSEDA